MKSLLLTFVLGTTAIFGHLTLADMLCAEASHVCVNPADDSLLILNKRAVRFCTINTQSTREELLAKLSFYQQCSELNGVVRTADMNK
jgi:hypothetical protein